MRAQDLTALGAQFVLRLTTDDAKTIEFYNSLDENNALPLDVIEWRLQLPTGTGYPPPPQVRKTTKSMTCFATLCPKSLRICNLYEIELL